MPQTRLNQPSSQGSETSVWERVLQWRWGWHLWRRVSRRSWEESSPPNGSSPEASICCWGLNWSLKQPGHDEPRRAAVSTISVSTRYASTAEGNLHDQVWRCSQPLELMSPPQSVDLFCGRVTWAKNSKSAKHFLNLKSHSQCYRKLWSFGQERGLPSRWTSCWGKINPQSAYSRSVLWAQLRYCIGTQQISTSVPTTWWRNCWTRYKPPEISCFVSVLW